MTPEGTSRGVAAGAAAPGRVASRPLGGGAWMIVLVALGLLVGILVVLLPSLLGSRPVTEAQPTRPPASGTLPEAALPADLRLSWVHVSLVGPSPEPAR